MSKTIQGSKLGEITDPLAQTEAAAAEVISEAKPQGTSTEDLMSIVSNPVMDDGVASRLSQGSSKRRLKVDPNNLSEDLIGHGVLIAKPLAMPELLNVKAKDPSIQFRWVNFKSEEGKRVAMHKAMGFEIAELIDVDERTPMPVDCHKTDYGITSYDVVLMKIQKLRLLQAYEHNHQRSEAMVGRKAAHKQALQKAVEQLKNDLTMNNIPAEYLRDKVEYFTPSEKVAEALTR